MTSAAKKMNRQANAALQRVAQALGLEWHDRIYRHPLLGDIALNGFCCGGYRGYAVFAGSMADSGGYRGAAHIATVLEISFPKHIAGTQPLRMTWIPPRHVAAGRAADAFDRYFRGFSAGSPSDAAREALLLLAQGATKLVIDADRLLLTPEGARIEDPVVLVRLLDRACDALEILGVKKWPAGRDNAVYDGTSLDAVWERYRQLGHRWSRATIGSIVVALGLLIYLVIHYYRG